MASMTLADIRAYVYSFLDIDTNDLPTSVLDLMIRQAWTRMASSERRWSFYEQSSSFATAPSTQEYALTGLGASDPWDDIIAITDPDWGPLRPVSHVAARRRYTSSNSSSRPRSFSFHRDTVWFWPIPNAAVTYTVDGYRKPRDWQLTSGSPDAPEEFHPLVAQYALSLAYGQQDDPAGAQQSMERFEQGFAQARQRYTDDSVAGPIILNGGDAGWSPSRMRDRADYFG